MADGSVYSTQETCQISDLTNREQYRLGDTVSVHGYLATKRLASKSLIFAQLLGSDLSHSVQLVISSKEGQDPRILAQVAACETYIPVCVTGVINARRKADASPRGVDDSLPINDIEISINELETLNDFPKDNVSIVKNQIVPAAHQRHLQIRSDRSLRDALALRSKVSQTIRRRLCECHDFLDIETPLLFKSTPEGAREFIVPTRTRSHAYALPQSPQQFKQLLMASGIPRYMQIAKCFRDEDQRADRQPEFTQVDLEMAFATGAEVMLVIEDIVWNLWSRHLDTDLEFEFPRLTYDQAMSEYGSDKPDRRFGSTIHRIEHMIPADMVCKISELHDPIVELLKLPTSNSRPAETRQFISDFMSSPAAAPFTANSHGQPGVFIFDAGKPLNGLQPFGFEAAERVEEILKLTHGDVVIVQARPNAPHDGAGSTMLGELRLALHRAAIEANMLSAPTGWDFLWITDFPLFTPIDPGPVTVPPGTELDAPADTKKLPPPAGPRFKSTHHPFTSPASDSDLRLLQTDPSALKAEHYDLVLNGVEVGGGSRRIHNATLQTHILTSILGLSPEDVERDFGHLIAALRHGCPPHAGFAIGFDRLLALMLRKPSVRDVIAFPKGKDGRDLTVGAPARLNRRALETYHLRIEGEGGRCEVIGRDR